MHRLRVILISSLLVHLTSCHFGHRIEYTETAVESFTTTESLTEDEYVKWVRLYISNTLGHPKNLLGMMLGGALLKQSRKQQLRTILPKLIALANNGEELDYVVGFFADLIIVNDLMEEVTLPLGSKEAEDLNSAKANAIEYYLRLFNEVGLKSDT